MLMFFNSFSVKWSAIFCGFCVIADDIFLLFFSDFSWFFAILFWCWLVGWLHGWFYGVSTIVGYLMPNSVFSYIKPYISERMM